MASTSQYSQLTIIEAITLFADSIQAEVDALILRLDLVDHVHTGSGLSKQNKTNEIIKFAQKYPSHQTVAGANLGDEVVEEAGKRLAKVHPSMWSNSPHSWPFLQALAKDGFMLTPEGVIHKTLPNEADLPQTESELYELLDEFKLTTVKGHLEQAITNHSQSNWASANAQLRTCLEGLFDEVALIIDQANAVTQSPGHNRRQFLANTEPPFLVEHLGEWSNDGKNFVNGIFKRLHPDGSHPGLSDEEDCTFRLHMVLIVARYFLRRAKYFLSTY